MQQVEIASPSGATHIHSRPALPAQDPPVPAPMQPGRKLKREWMIAHNVTAAAQDCEVTPYQALPGPSRPMQGENDVAPTALNMQAANLNVSFQILFLANDSFSQVNLKD